MSKIRLIIKVAMEATINTVNPPTEKDIAHFINELDYDFQDTTNSALIDNTSIIDFERIT